MDISSVSGGLMRQRVPIGNRFRRAATASVVALACALLLAAGPLSGQPAASATTRELLNSERIEQRFGSYDIDVVESNGRLRISNLYSTDNGEPTTRTLAIVTYIDPVPPALLGPHAEIVAGGSIGATLARAGWTVVKEHRYFGEVEADTGLVAGMRLERPEALALHIYVLSAQRGAQTHPYVAIAEVHHPDYLDYPALIRIYAPDWVGNEPDPVSLELHGLVESRIGKIKR
jgi:hypothetical protein